LQNPDLPARTKTACGGGEEMTIWTWLIKVIMFVFFIDDGVIRDYEEDDVPREEENP
jgi:hypothetical protein